MTALRTGSIGFVLFVLGSLSGCGVKCDAPYSCDIRDASCQRQVLDALQCVRGGSAVDVPVRVINADDYADDEVDMIDEAEQARQRALFTGLSMLKLVSPDLTPAAAARDDIANTGAFYDSDEQAVTVLDRGIDLSNPGMVRLLAHELVHAQQDAEHHLDAPAEPERDTFDASLALDAIIEGEATLYADQFSAYALGFELDDLSWSESLKAARADNRRSAIEDDNPFLQLRWTFAYPYGASYVYRAREAAGDEAVAALYDDPPVSTRQVIIGYGQKPPAGKPWLEPELAEQAVPSVEGITQHITTLRLGAYALGVTLDHWVRHAPSEIDGELFASKLRSDELTIQAGEDGQLLVSWRLRLTDADTAQALAEKVRRHHPNGTHIKVVDRDLLLLKANGPALDGVSISEIEWGPIPTDAESESETEMPPADSRAQPVGTMGRWR